MWRQHRWLEIMYEGVDRIPPTVRAHAYALTHSYAGGVVFACHSDDATNRQCSPLPTIRRVTTPTPAVTTDILLEYCCRRRHWRIAGGLCRDISRMTSRMALLLRTIGPAVAPVGGVYDAYAYSVLMMRGEKRFSLLLCLVR